MFTRYLAAATVAAVVGCSTAPIGRALWRPGASVFVPLGKNTATAELGDEVDLEVGRGLADAGDHGFRVFINGRPAGRSGWITTNGTLDVPSGNLRYKFRPPSAGNYHVDVITHYPGKEEETLAWDITVTE